MEAIIISVCLLLSPVNTSYLELQDKIIIII